MWVSIVAWVVTVMSSLFRLECGLWSSSRLGTFRIGVGNASIYLHRMRWSQGKPLLRFEPCSLRHWPVTPSIEEWLSRHGPAPTREPLVWAPAWYLAVVPTIAFLNLHRRDRRLAHRLKHDLCTRCGYSRAGIAEGAACPECGQ